MSNPSRWRINLERLGVLATILIVWSLLSGPVLPTNMVSSPGEVWSVLIGWISEPLELLPHVGVTFFEASVGYLIGGALGIAIGALFGIFPFLAKTLDPAVTAVYALPKITLAPMFVLMFGVGLVSKIALVAIIVFFFIFYNTLNGVRAVDVDIREAVQVIGASRGQLLRHVILPSTWEWILDGLKISVPSAFIGAVGGEMIVSQQGLGFLVRDAARTLDVAEVLAAIVIIVLLSTIVNAIVTWGRARAGAWRSDASVI
ncbi:ABC transporter permease [Actinophytocola sp.]|uniref:ABC transporter permease n=1 Tax=Actinophytocola sp. TaxID=1872138 RepID=UPI003D6BA9B3